MCCGCWQEDGAHQLDTPLVRQLVALEPDVDHYGCLHIVVDDDNLETDTIKWCYDNRHNNGHKPWTETDQRMYDLLMAATFEERVSAAGIWNGCWAPARCGGTEA